MRVVLPLGNGGVVHLFVVYGYQGADNDPEKLQLTEHLFAAVLAEARLCCAGQPVVLAGDFNVDPIVIPSLAKGISDGHWVDLEYAFSFGRGVLPSSTCQFQLDEDKGSRRDFILACSIALAAASMCSVLSDRWFTPHFAVHAEFALSSWDAFVERARIHPCGLLAGWIAPIAADLLRHRLFVIFGRFTFVRLVLYLLRFVLTFFVCVILLMLIHPGFFGVVRLRLVFLVPILLQVALSSQILVVMLDEVLSPFAPYVWAGGVMVVSVVLIVLMSLTLPILASF